MTSERQRLFLKTGGLVMIIPDKPQSSRQRYITAETGKNALNLN
jgi:hypothetical protein